MWRSNSSVISRAGCPPDIVNEEDHTVEDNEFPDFQKWNIPKVDTKIVYNTITFLTGDSVVMLSIFLSVSTRNFDTPLLCSLLPSSVSKSEFQELNSKARLSQKRRVGHERYRVD